MSQRVPRKRHYSFCKDTGCGGILSSGTREEKEKSRKCLKKIFGAVQFLARQGLPLRGDGLYELDGNFNQLIKLLSKEDANLATWTKTKTDRYTSKDVQNEVLRVMDQRVLRDIVSDIRLSGFTIMVNEATDISTREQIVFVLRRVDDRLDVHKDFVGLYSTASRTADSPVTIIQDVLLRLNLSIQRCRGQCYDGADVMKGQRNVVATQMSCLERRARYTH